MKKWIFEEIQEINKIQFLYKDKQSAMNTAYLLASRMLEYPIEDVLHVNELMENYEEKLL